jgi:DNA (cytosine-5)-methyltransferase 1
MKVVELYGGAGGMGCGLIQAGLEVVLAVDIWRDALRVYERNLKVPTLRWDLSKVPVLPPADAILGGPPCQDYSLGGHRVEGARARQTLHFAFAVARHRPRFFAMENVARARLCETYALAKAHLTRQGYGLTEVVLRGCWYGVPQKRRRVLLVGELGGKDDALRSLLLAGKSDRPTTIRDHCGDRLGTDYFYRHYRNERCVWSIDEIGPTITNEYRRGRLPAHYTPRPGDATTDLSRVRALTLREAAMIQTFEDDWNWLPGVVRVKDAWQMVANAVPPKLAEHLGRALIEAWEGSE